MIKQCTKCGGLKMDSAFYRDKSRKAGIHPWCKECSKDRSKKYYAANIDKFSESNREYRKQNPRAAAEYGKMYRKTPEGKKSISDSIDRYRKRNPLKKKAHAAVRNALKSGKLNKPDRCSCCGERNRSFDIHAHHNDYGEQLDVVWLCRECHIQTHKQKITHEKES